MSKVSNLPKKRSSVDVYDQLTLKLGHVAALLEVMAVCDKEECDVNAAAYGLNYMIEASLQLAREFYEATTAA